MKQPDDSPVTPHTQRIDNPEALAKHAIRVLENYILKKHDLIIPMGAELEFSTLLKNPLEDYNKLPPYGVGDANTVKLGNHTPSVFRYAKQRDPWFPESRRITYSYLEESIDDQWDKLEVVLTHCPSDAAGNPIPHNGLILGRNIEALRNQLHTPSSGYKPSVRGKTPAHVGADGWREFRQTELAALSTEPMVKGTLNTNGLHLNMSLVDAQTADNVLEHAGVYRRHIVDSVSNSIGHVFRENAYLITHGESSIQRWSQRQKADRSSCRQEDTVPLVHRKSTSSYIENAIPDASANPYYAIMLQLAATAKALDSAEFSYHERSPFYRSTPTPTSSIAQDWGNVSMQRLKEEFTTANTLRDVLNTCEPALGDRFMAAIEKCPPGQENKQTIRR